MSNVSHSTIINLKTNESKKYDKEKVKRRKKRADQCIGCEHNQAGFCSDKKNWCFNSQPSCDKCVQQVIEIPVPKKKVFSGKKKRPIK